MNNSILILGGMGPQASLELHRLLIEKLSKNVRTPGDYPNILHASLSVPDFIVDSSEIGHAIENINTACKTLPLESAAAIGIACNTAHLLVPSLTDLPKGKFISMIDSVSDAVKASDVRTVGLIASPHTIQSKLYETPLKERGLDVLTPPQSEMSEIAKIIRSVVAGAAPQTMRNRLSEIANDLERKGADCIILGCTELPLIGVNSALPVFSSLEVLASALLTKHAEVQ